MFVCVVLVMCLIWVYFVYVASRMNVTGVNDKKCMQFSAAVNMVIINSWRLLSLIIYLAYVIVTICTYVCGYARLFIIEMGRC